MGQHSEEIKDAGYQLVAVGLGQPKHAERYCGSLAPNAHCLADIESEAYPLYGLGEGKLSQLLSLNTVRAGATAAKNGHSQGQSTGNSKMLGGTFLVDTDGVIQRAYYSEFAGDDPDLVSFIAKAYA